MVYRCACHLPWPTAELMAQLRELVQDRYGSRLYRDTKRDETRLGLVLDVPESDETMARAIASSLLADVGVDVDPDQFYVTRSNVRPDCA